MRWWILWRVPILALIVMALWWFVFRPWASSADDWVSVDRDFGICGVRSSTPSQGCVIDGDTIAIGFSEGARRIRLTGFDAPELDGACSAEREKALEARDALHAWLAQDDVEWSGADDPAYDQYGRELREVRRRIARDRYEYLADHMLELGLAAESGWGTTPRDWCR